MMSPSGFDLQRHQNRVERAYVKQVADTRSALQKAHQRSSDLLGTYGLKENKAEAERAHSGAGLGPSSKRMVGGMLARN